MTLLKTKKRLFRILDNAVGSFITIFFIFKLIVLFAEVKELTLFSASFPINEIMDVLSHFISVGIIMNGMIGWFITVKELKKIGVTKEEKKFRLYILSLTNKAYCFTNGKKEISDLKKIEGWSSSSIIATLLVFFVFYKYCETGPLLVRLLILIALVYAMLLLLSNYYIYRHKLERLIEKGKNNS